jgi:hypothetical protein
MQEMKQLDELEVIQPRNWSELTAEQRQTALPYLMFLTEKRDKTVNRIRAITSLEVHNTVFFTSKKYVLIKLKTTDYTEYWIDTSTSPT